MLRLPSKPWSLWMLAMFLWMAQPILIGKFLIITQHLRWYPSGADSIGIPMFGAIVFALFGLPVWWMICRTAFHPYPKAGLLEWSSAHSIYSTITTLIFAGCVALNIGSGLESIRLYREVKSSALEEVSPFAIYRMGASLGWIAIWLAMRSCFIARKSATTKVVLASAPKET